MGLILVWQLVLASVLMLAEYGPNPITLGGVSPEKVVSLSIFSMKTALYRLFEFEARSPKEEHRGRQALVGFRAAP